MKIVICSSMSFAKEYSEIAKELTKKGHNVIMPLGTDAFIKGERTNNRNTSPEILTYARKEQLEFYDIMKSCDCILVTNYDKNNIEGYVGGSVLMEMTVGFFLRKPIFLLNDIPSEDKLRYSQEIQLIQPIVINGDLDKIKT